MKIDLNTSLKNNIHENSLTKTMTNKKFKIYPRSKVEKLITEFAIKHDLHGEFVQQTEGLLYARFVVEEDKEDD